MTTSDALSVGRAMNRAFVAAELVRLSYAYGRLGHIEYSRALHRQATRARRKYEPLDSYRALIARATAGLR